MKQFPPSFMRLAAAAFAGAVFAVAGIATVSAQDVAAGDAANGKRLYLAADCFECHGRAGQGGAMNYPTPALAQLELPCCRTRTPPISTPSCVRCQGAGLRMISHC